MSRFALGRFFFGCKLNVNMNVYVYKLKIVMVHITLQKITIAITYLCGIQNKLSEGLQEFLIY